MSVKCGNRKCGNDGRHETVKEVRACYAATASSNGDVSDDTINPASDGQKATLANLMDEKVWTDRVLELIKVKDIEQMDRSEASALIQAFYDAPKKPGSHRFQDVPAGKYALETSLDHDGEPAAEEKGVLQFFQVDHGKVGSRWEGYVFVKRLVGAPGDFARYPLRYAEGRRVLERIQADPKGASQRFGLHFTVCGRCSSPLTDETSRAEGIGPKCRAKLGW
jgi:hypothetical protein